MELDLYKSTCMNQALVKMIQSCWQTDMGEEHHLKTVKLSSVSFQFDSLTKTQFEKLVDGGLQLFFMDSRQFEDM
jgi:hypothetical protein